MDKHLRETAADLVASQSELPPPTLEPVTALAMLEQVFFENDHDVVLEPADEMHGPEALYVSMGEMDGYLLTMKFVSLLNAAPPAPQEDPPPDILLGTLVLPLDIAPDRVGDISRAMLQANRFLPVSSFCLSLGDDGSATCYLQTNLTLEPANDFPFATAQTVVSSAAWALNTFAPLLAAAVHDSALSTADYLAERGLTLTPVTAVKRPMPTAQPVPANDE